MVEPQKEKRLPAAKRRQIEARQDADDFAAEYRMLKKVKKGKMSEVQNPAANPPQLRHEEPSASCILPACVCKSWVPPEPRDAVSACRRVSVAARNV